MDPNEKKDFLDNNHQSSNFFPPPQSQSRTIQTNGEGSGTLDPIENRCLLINNTQVNHTGGVDDNVVDDSEDVVQDCLRLEKQCEELRAKNKKYTFSTKEFIIIFIFAFLTGLSI